jgi:stage V sporulation protein R
MCCKLPKTRLKTPKFKGAEWSFENINKGWEIIQEIGKKYDWKGYPTQFEVLNSEQMLDMYASNGMPTFYSHWSFGKNL